MLISSSLTFIKKKEKKEKNPKQNHKKEKKKKKKSVFGLKYVFLNRLSAQHIHSSTNNRYPIADTTY